MHFYNYYSKADERDPNETQNGNDVQNKEEEVNSNEVGMQRYILTTTFN